MPSASTPARDTAAAPLAGGVLRLARPAVHVPGARRPAGPSARELRVLPDLLAAFGMRPDLEQYARGGGNSFAAMSRELFAGLDGALPPLDPVVLAYHLPDLGIIDVPGCYVSGRLPGAPTVFSVSEQGVGAPFTALRVLDGMRRAGLRTDGAVLVLDQSTSPYWDADTHTVAAQDCAVLLRTRPPDAVGRTVALDFLAEDPVTDPAAALRTTAARRPGARVIVGRMLGEQLASVPDAGLDVVAGPKDRLCTSAWSALAEQWPPERYTVVADYDPHARRLFQAGLDPRAPR